MHDRLNRPLAVGDVVLIPAVITQLSDQTEEYCNVSLTSVFGRRPDDAKETFGAINTGVLLKHTIGGSNEFMEDTAHNTDEIANAIEADNRHDAEEGEEAADA